MLYEWGMTTNQNIVLALVSSLFISGVGVVIGMKVGAKQAAEAVAPPPHTISTMGHNDLGYGVEFLTVKKPDGGTVECVTVSNNVSCGW